MLEGKNFTGSLIYVPYSCVGTSDSDMTQLIIVAPIHSLPSSPSDRLPHSTMFQIIASIVAAFSVNYIMVRNTFPHRNDIYQKGCYNIFLIPLSKNVWSLLGKLSFSKKK